MYDWKYVVTKLVRIKDIVVRKCGTGFIMKGLEGNAFKVLDNKFGNICQSIIKQQRR